jgi:nicotinamidase-related amidase
LQLHKQLKNHKMKKGLFQLVLLMVTMVLTTATFAQSKVPTQFTSQNSAILLVDHQKTTMDWIYSQDKKLVKQNLRMLARIGADLKVPMIITTTMEAQVGTTWEDIQTLAPVQYAARVKRGGTINCFLDPNFSAAVKALDRKKLIICGLTTDICLLHTVQGALRNGYEVMVVADACGSMTPMADEVSFNYLRQLGVYVVSANSVLSELYSDFGSAEGQKAMQINLEEVVSKLGK